MTPGIRRLRFLTYAQFTPEFTILMHWGVNGLGVNNMDPIGNRSDGPQLFLHGAWMEYHLIPQAMTFGAGLHYWNGPSRQGSASTITYMAIDNFRPGWSKLGLTDQFARNMGVFLKGQYGKFTYNISLDAPLANSLDVPDIPTVPNGETLYTGRFESDEASWLTQGYFKWDFFDVESCVLPYRVGSHLGKLRVLSVGAGFVNHPKGSITYETDGQLTQNNMSQFAIDVYYDQPFAKTVLTSYFVYYNFDYGPNYYRENLYGTGNAYYAESGFLLPMIDQRFQFQPYLAYGITDYEIHENPGETFNAGLNFYLAYHQAKTTLEYRRYTPNYTGPRPDVSNLWRIQIMVYM